MNSGIGTSRTAHSKFRAISFDGNDLGECAIARPDRYAYFDRVAYSRPLIARGAGLSYAAASFGRSSVSVEMTSFDRILHFSACDRIVEVEAGMRIGELFNFLAVHGLYLPVQPGHGALSIGGCIAADVHGKNQVRDGTFINQVECLRLFHPNHGIIELSNDKQPEIFRATCGGYGTTGIIVSARLRLKPMPAPTVSVEILEIADFRDLASPLTSAAAHCDYVYSWHDFTNTSAAAFGRGYLVKGRFLNSTDIKPAQFVRSFGRRISSGTRGAHGLRVYYGLSTQLMNFGHRKAVLAHRAKVRALSQALFPIHGSEYYFRGFGKKGFHEHQALIPLPSFEKYALGLRNAIRQSGSVVTLASAKMFGGNADLLRFSGEGICLAINIPRTSTSGAFMRDLDRLLAEAGGKPNIIKDSRLPQAVVAAAYPEYSRFRTVLHAWDPNRLFRSELTERLAL